MKKSEVVQYISWNIGGVTGGRNVNFYLIVSKYEEFVINKFYMQSAITFNNYFLIYRRFSRRIVAVCSIDNIMSKTPKITSGLRI